MNRKESRIALATVFLRIMLGWFMFADGLQILLQPNWSATGFLLHAKTFPAFYAWFASPYNIWWIDPLNSWGITLVGLALLIGVGVRPAAWAGFALMILYYFPHNVFPYVTYGFIVEEHVIYAAAFLLIAVSPYAQSWGLSNNLRGTFLGRVPVVGKLL
jgi:thiosulfate dehydrogenase [quinone] large subunit